MKTLLLALILFNFSILLTRGQDQNGSIKGYIKNEHNEPLFQATVIVKGTTTGATTTADGYFELKNVSPGTYALQFSYVGYDSETREAVVEPEHASTLNVSLASSATSLQSVEITGRKERDYKNTLTFSGTKTATAIKDVPQAISYVTKEVMQDQGAVRMGDIVKNVSGVNQYTFYDDITIRGFRNQGGVGSNSSTQLFNGMRTFTGFWKQPLVNYLERVEIIKGPASALYGNANPGGTVNKVTKKPLDEDRKSMSFTLGKYNTVRAFSDFTGPLNEDKTLLYRLNLGYENANSFRDLQFDKNIVIAPSVSFLPDEKTRLNIDAVYNKSNSRLDRGQAIFGSDDLYSTPVSQSLSEVNDYLNEETYMITASLTHQFTEKISFNTSYLRTGYRLDLLEHRSNNAFAKDRFGRDIITLASRQVNDRHNERFADSFTAYLNMNLETGSLEHKLLIGYDYVNSQIPQGSSQSDATGYRLKDGTIASRYVVKDSLKYEMYRYNGEMIPLPNVPSYDLTTNTHIMQDMSKYVFTAASNDVVVPIFMRLSSVYIQDQIRINKLQLLLGLRFDNYTDKIGYQTANVTTVKQHAFIPRFGAVYEISKNINAYATYARGYNPVSAATQANTETGGPFDPEESSLMEGGVKIEWFNKRLNVTASLYHIEQQNTLYPASDPDRPDLLIQIGKDISKGFELEVIGNVATNFNIIAAYAFVDATLQGAQNSTDTLYNEQQKPNAPKNQGSLWLKYEFSGNFLKGFGIGAGANYVGSRIFGSQSSTLVGQPGPEFMLFNAAVYYKVNKVQIQANLNNLTNKTHWVGGYDHFRLYPGTPFNWQTTISYTF